MPRRRVDLIRDGVFLDAVYDMRTGKQAGAFAQPIHGVPQQGGVAAANPAEVGANASVVVVLVVNAEQTEEVLFGRNGAAPRMARSD